jgi:UDP-4-amino-4,6-dideoxy-N-acetyl-beta-L-altrosamine N-acetyltransferase
MFRYGKLYFRPIEEKDLEKIRKMRNEPTTWMNLTDITLLDSNMQKEWFSSLAKQLNRCRYYVVCKGKDTFVGIIRMDEIDWVNRSIRVGCDVVPNLRGKGYGKLIMEMIKEYCFKYMNMHRLWLAVLEFNRIARHIYEKAGFKVEGRYRKAIYRNGKYHDYILMSILKEEQKNDTSI